MPRTEDRVEELVTALRANGHRLTPQRLAVLRVLGKSTDHPSVEQIYRKVRRQYPMISRATVYKTVETLKGMAQVLEMEFSGAGNRYDGRRAESHPHLFARAAGASRTWSSRPWCRRPRRWLRGQATSCSAIAWTSTACARTAAGDELSGQQIT